MTNPVLSICIPSTPDRRDQCELLVGEFLRQAMQIYPAEEFRGFVRNVPGGVIGGWTSPDIEMHYYEDNRTMSVGAKRDALYRMSNGIYALQWDSDDGVHPDAISKIMYALSSRPDCVTYRERCDMDGVVKKSNHSTSYRDWEGDGSQVLSDGFHFHRTPFFKDVIRRDYCVHIGVADMRYGEDHDFSLLIKPMLLNEVHIDEELYLYNYTPAEHNVKYGIK
jgi:hypothetical protein